MRKITKVFMLSLAMGIVFTACNKSKKEHEETLEVSEEKEHATHDEEEAHDHGYEMAMATYQCPMKCEGEKTYAEEGTCPECKMDLKKNEVTSNEEVEEENEME